MKLWSGRFKSELDTLAEEFNDSLPFDREMYREDIAGSVAHCTMLGECGIIKKSEADTICAALDAILADIDGGALAVENAEDIHSFAENELVRRVGDVGKKLHTARSRNDQVATDLRLYVRAAVDEEIALLKTLISAIVERAASERETAMPAYTHMQKAQPTTLAHWLLAYASMFLRDAERLQDCRKRVNVLPLGSGACASTTFPIDRELTARLLGFDGVTQNSLDGVSDRDFVIEYLACATQIMLHLSRINEEFVYWSGEEFSFISLPDELSTGSSIMPQKKNPDVNELLRGKCGRVFGALAAMTAVIKGLPLAYNKDMQEDKEGVFDTRKTLGMSLRVFTRFVQRVEFNRNVMKKAATGGHSCATECADYLADKGLPFREAHGVAGKLVLYCIENGKTLQQLTLDEFKAFSPLFEHDVLKAVQAESAISRRKVTGGCAPQETARQIRAIKAAVKKL